MPDLPRFTGGAVGYLGYDAAHWFEPVPTASGPIEGPAAAADLGGFMLFDTVLASTTRSTGCCSSPTRASPRTTTCEALYQFACARIQFLEAELERSLSTTRTAPGGAGDAARRT